MKKSGLAYDQRFTLRLVLHVLLLAIATGVMAAVAHQSANPIWLVVTAVGVVAAGRYLVGWTLRAERSGR